MSGNIVENIDDVGLSVRVMEDLISRNLQHFVVPSESNNNSICLVVYENERWSSMVKQWGSVLGVHLYVNSVLGDRRPLTDETGKHVLSESLADLQPLNKFKWREDWTIMVDFTTDNDGYHYAHDWASLSDKKKRQKAENKSTSIRRRRWKRVMVFDSDSHLQTLPYLLTVKIKSAIFTGKMTPTHKIEAYVETFLDNVLLDRTLTGPPMWNRVIVEKLLYLEPSSVIVFQLYKKKRSKTGFELKGTLVVKMSDIIDLTNRGPYEIEYALIADKPRKLLLEWDVKETKLFSLVKMRPRNTESTEDAQIERDQLEKKLSPRLRSTLSQFEKMQSSLMEIILDCLIEEPDALQENDLLITVEDLLETKRFLAAFLGKSESVDVRSLMRRTAITDSEGAIVYPYGKFNYSKCISVRSLLSDAKQVSRDTYSRQKSIQDINEDLFTNQPIRSSLFDVRFENYLTSNQSINTIAMTGYDLTIDSVTGTSYELHWQTYYDYIMVLKEISKIRFMKYDHSTPEFSSSVKYITEKKTWKDVTFVISYETEQIAIKEIHINVINGRRASQSFSYGFMKGSQADDDALVEIFIPFNLIESYEINYSNHLSLKYILEVKVDTITSFLFRNAAYSYLDIDSSSGTHYRTILDCETASKSGNYFEPITIPAEKTFHFLLSDKLLSDTKSTKDFLYFTLHSSDIDTQTSRLGKKNQEAITPTSSRSLFSFGSGNKKNNSSVQAPSWEQASQVIYSKISLPVNILVTPESTSPKDSQILFQNSVSHFQLKLKVLKGENLVSMDSNESVSPYFVLYFADSDGIVCLSHSFIDHSSKAVVKSSNASNLNGIKPGFFYRSKVVPKSHCPLWNDEIEISSEIFDDLLGSIKYILVEVWDKNSINSDNCIGEVYISIHSAVNTAKESEQFLACKHVLQFSKSTKSKSYGRSEVDRCKLGNLYAALSMSEIYKPNSNLADNKVSVKLSCSIRPIQIMDCAWPCRVMSAAKSGWEDFVLNLYISHNSLVLSSFDSNRPSTVAINSKMSEKFKALQECVENVYAIDENDAKLRLIIPFSQITEDSVFILSDNMLFLTLFVMRRIAVNGDDESFRFKGLTIDLVVGPCPASDFYSMLTSRINLQNTKSKLLSFIMQDKSQVPSDNYKAEFQSTIQLMQFEIFSVMESTLSHSAYQSNSADENAVSIQKSREVHSLKGNQSAKSNQSPNGHRGKDPDSFITLRVLLCQKAWLRVYNWFLMSFGPTVQNDDGETQIFTMKGIEDNFTKYAKDLLSSTISEDVDDITETGILKMDPTSLLYNIRELMNKLEDDVRALFYESFVFERSHLLTSALLSKLVFDQYLLIVLYLTKMSFPLENTAHKNIRGTSPQDKRDLIVYIISHDDLFESCLNMSLLSNNFCFNVPPFLSLCIDFDKLIGEFSSLLDENLKQWNSRALKHFLGNAERTNDILPWDITTIVDPPTGKELYISSIPETIQMQLNIQIGLKKIPVPKNVTTQSLQRVCKINLKISAAVAKSYLGLASEFDQVVANLVQSEKFAHNDDKENSANDDLMYFLISIVNDCNRIIFKHIRESMDSFNDDGEIEKILNNGEATSDNGRRRSSSSGNKKWKEGTIVSEEFAAIQASREQVMNLFANSSRVLEGVSKNSLNHLSNQIFFNSLMTGYFLEGLNGILHTKPSATFGFRSSISSDPNISPIDIICATLSDFLTFVGKHLYSEDWEKLAFMCLKKVVLRYLIFLRDLLVTSNAASGRRFAPSRILSFRRKNRDSISSGIRGSIQSSSTVAFGVTDGLEDVEHEEDCDTMSITSDSKTAMTDLPDMNSIVARIRADVRSILLLYSNTIIKNRELKKTAQEYEDSHDYEPSECGDDNETVSAPQSSSYEKASSGMLSLLSNTSTLIISGDISESSAIEKIIKNMCYVTIPEYNANKAVYNHRLTDFFMLSSMSSTVSSRIDCNLGSLQATPTYFIQLSEFALINLGIPKNCFLRINFQDNAQETSIQQNGGPRAIVWKDVIRLMNVQDYQNAVLTIQLVEFRIRAVKAFREKVVGLVVINLSDVDSPARSIANDSSERSDSNSGEQVFALSGWFEVDTTSQKLVSRIMRRQSISMKSDGKKASASEGSESASRESKKSKKESLSFTKAAATASSKSAAAVCAPTPREHCKSPQLSLLITVTRSFVH